MSETSLFNDVLIPELRRFINAVDPRDCDEVFFQENKLISEIMLGLYEKREISEDDLWVNYLLACSKFSSFDMYEKLKTSAPESVITRLNEECK